MILYEPVAGRVLVPEIGVARTCWQRMVGLLGRRSLPAGQGLWFAHCNSIHMFGMRFAIDVLFFDHAMRLRTIKQELQPWRIAFDFTARHCLELTAGEAARVGFRVGSVYQLRDTE